MRTSRLTAVLILLFIMVLARPVYSSSLTLVVTTNRQAPAVYGVGDSVTLTGSVNNGSAVPDALVFFEVDTPKHNPWIIRTLTTGQTPAGPWTVQLLSVTPCDAYGDPIYTFSAGNDAGFNVTLRNNALSAYTAVVTINAFFSNGLPFVLMTVFNGTLQPGQTASVITWPVNIPVNSVNGQAIVYASVFNDYPKNEGLPYSPEQSATFNINSGTPQQAPTNSTLGTFNMTVPLASTPSLPIWVGNYSVYAITHYGYSVALAQTNFTAKLIEDITGPNGVPDGKVDIRDISLVAKHFDTVAGGPNWDPVCDLTGPNGVPDGKVDIRDISLVAKAFGIVVNLDP